MTTVLPELKLDLLSGTHGAETERLVVRLQCSPLEHLVSAAARGHRIYELLLITRPGDVWAYVSVEIEQCTPAEMGRLRSRIADAGSLALDGPVSFSSFDDLFFDDPDGGDDLDLAWEGLRDNGTLRAYASRVLESVRAEQSRLAWQDDLFRHVADLVRARQHPYDFLDLEAARRHTYQVSCPAADAHAQSFYSKLAGLLRDPDVMAVSYVGEGDFRVLRMMATEQRRRATKTGHRLRHSLRLNATVNVHAADPAWCAEVWYSAEGFGFGDLLIVTPGIDAADVAYVLSRSRRLPPRHLLCTEDHGPMDGFDRSIGDGWALYSSQSPASRRSTMERFGAFHLYGERPALCFADSGGMVWSYERVLIVVGSQISAGCRQTLAHSIRDWEAHGDGPMVLVSGDVSAFASAGCRGVIPVPDEWLDANDAHRWFRSAIGRFRTWIDAVVALDIDDAFIDALRSVLLGQSDPWRTWVVADRELPQIDVNLLLNGEIDDAVAAAVSRAASRDPRL